MSAGRSVLLGWGNSTRSQLAAYEKLHASCGLAPLTVIPDTRAGLVDPSAYARTIAPVAGELAANEPTTPIVVHLFSDNGFIGWAALLDALVETDRGRRTRDAIRGVILDSAPGLWNVRGRLDFARRFALGMTPALSRALGLGARERLPVATKALGAAFVAYQLIFRAPVKYMLSAADRIGRAQPRCPHLFLYGGADTLVPAADVRAWIAAQRDAGIAVDEAFFARAKHVALYPADPRTYRREVTRFVDRVLA